MVEDQDIYGIYMEEWQHVVLPGDVRSAPRFAIRVCPSLARCQVRRQRTESYAVRVLFIFVRQRPPPKFF